MKAYNPFFKKWFLIWCSGLMFFVSITGCGTKHKNLVELVPGVDRPRIGLVLGGGAARGFAHIGVIRALEQEKIPVDLIIGISVGSLVGVLYADKADSFELEWNAFSLQKDDIFDFSLLRVKTGPVKGDRLEKFVQKHVSVPNIEDLKIPFVAVAVDLNTGQEVVLDKGPVGQAVRASSSIPGIFEPYIYQEKTLVDGGALGSITPEVARRLGADIVITVDIGKGIENYEINNVIEITLQAINIMGNKINQYKLKDTDILIQPDVGDVNMMDFTKKKQCMIAGINAAKGKANKIHSLISRWKKK